MSSAAKPVPVPDEASRPFFDAAADGRLALQRCTACGAWMWPVKPRCVECFSPALEWADATGRGHLYTFSVMHQLYHPGFAEEIPYTIAVGALDEGVRVSGNVRGVATEDLEIGMPLRVAFETVGEDGVALPRFRPAED
jgi:uncharacterized OB-fold protein